jgi:hypothetical protein
LYQAVGLEPVGLVGYDTPAVIIITTTTTDTHATAKQIISGTRRLACQMMRVDEPPRTYLRGPPAQCPDHRRSN